MEWLKLEENEKIYNSTETEDLDEDDTFVCVECGDTCEWDELTDDNICKDCLSSYDSDDDEFQNSSRAYNMDAITGSRFGR